MDRRKLLAAAGTLAAIAFAAAVAVAANVGLFGLTREDEGPGHLRLVTSSQVTSTSAPSATSTTAPSDTATTHVSQPSVTSSSSPGSHDDDAVDDSENAHPDPENEPDEDD